MPVPDAPIHVRHATHADLTALGRLGAHLDTRPPQFDLPPFIAPTSNLEAGYAHFLGTQLDVDDAIVLVAERAGAAVGYVFAGIEPFSWKELRDAAGFVHDIVVDPSERRSGVAGALMEAAIAWVREQGIASVMLWTRPERRRAAPVRRAGLPPHDDRDDPGRLGRAQARPPPDLLPTSARAPPGLQLRPTRLPA